jgi:hypothetical protein
MSRIALTKNLFLDEYIPRELYEKYKGREGVLITLLDRRLVLSDQMLRDVFGSVTINNWWIGGDRNWSGLRTPDSPYFSQTSQHTFGRASDKIFTNTNASEVQAYILDRYRDLNITGMELETSWVHTDVRYPPANFHLITFKP